MGLRPPAASARPLPPRPLPRMSRRGPTLASAPHSWAPGSPPHRPNQSRISTQDPGQTFPLGLVYSHTRTPFPGEEERWRFGQLPGALRGPPATRFPRSPCAHPCLPTPDLDLPRPCSGKPPRLMRPGCFRFAFAPFSPQLERLRKNKMGVENACPDKSDGNTAVRSQAGRGEREAQLRPGYPCPLHGRKGPGGPGLFFSCKET